MSVAQTIGLGQGFELHIMLGQGFELYMLRLKEGPMPAPAIFIAINKKCKGCFNF